MRIEEERRFYGSSDCEMMGWIYKKEDLDTEEKYTKKSI
jgi:hypothetical protein